MSGARGTTDEGGLRRNVLCGLVAGALMTALTGAADQPRAKPRLAIVALGDSTTAGTPDFQSPVEAPPAGRGNIQSQYAHWMTQRHPEWCVLNRGVNGERTDEIFRRFARDVAAVSPQIVIILAGVNDLYRGAPAARVEQQLRRLYGQARRAHIIVIACTILPYNGMSEAVRQQMAEVNVWIRDYSREQGLLFCDAFHAVEDPAQPWHLRGTPDGLHPDVDGYRRLGEALTTIIEQLPIANQL